MDTKAAWAAGFYDGEGGTYRSTKRRGSKAYAWFCLAITNTDVECLQRFARIVAAGRIVPIGPSALSKRPRFRLYVQRREDVVRVLRLLWPQLSQAKREQAKSCGVFSYNGRGGKMRGIQTARV